MGYLSISAWQPLPGRRAELVEVIKAQKEASVAAGAKVFATVDGMGTTSLGQVTFYQGLETTAEIGAFIDGSMASGGPLYGLRTVADPPAECLGVFRAHRIGALGVPEPKRITALRSYRLAPTRRDEGLRAIEAALEVHAELGGAPSAWQLDFAGPASGTITYALPFDNWVALYAFEDALRADGRRPIRDATAAGAIVPTTTQLAVLLPI